MKKTYKLWELEEGKEYEEVGSGVKCKVYEGELYEECEREGYSTTPCILVLTLSEVNVLEFLEVGSEFNPYATEFSEMYCWIYSDGDLGAEEHAPMSSEVDYGSVYSDKRFAEWKSKERKLLNNLERFSYENGGSEIDWKNWEQDKYHIIVDFEHGIDVRWVRHIKDLGQVYFISKEVAKQALEKYRDLIEEVYFQNKY